MTDRVLHPSERPRKTLAPPEPMAAATRTGNYLKQNGYPHTAVFLTGPQNKRTRKKLQHALRKIRETT